MTGRLCALPCMKHLIQLALCIMHHSSGTLKYACRSSGMLLLSRCSHATRAAARLCLESRHGSISHAHTYEVPGSCPSMRQTLPSAAGGATGEVIIWDFETKGVARASQPHDQAVTAVAWTRDGRHVISASENCTVSSLSILDNKQVQSPSPLLCSAFCLWQNRAPLAACSAPVHAALISRAKHPFTRLTR